MKHNTRKEFIPHKKIARLCFTLFKNFHLKITKLNYFDFKVCDINMDVDEIARMILLRVHQRNLNLFSTQGRVKKIELMLRGCDLVRITKLYV